MSRKILFYPVHGVYLRYMKPIFSEISKNSDSVVEVLLENRILYDEVGHYKKYILNELFSSKNIKKRRISIKDKFQINKIENLQITEKLRYIFYLLNSRKIIGESFLYFKRLKNLSLGLMKNIKPNLVVLSGDRHLDYELPIIWACNKLKIETLILPVGGSAGPEFLSPARRNNNFFFASNNFAKKFPGNTWYDPKSDKYISFFRNYLTLVLQKLELLPPNSKYFGGGNASLTLVDNEQIEKQLLDQGISKEKIKVTGNLMYDELSHGLFNKKELRKDIFHRYNLDYSKDLLVVGLPQLAEHNYMSWEKHWYFQNKILSEISKLPFNIILSLHPKMSYSNYSFLEKKYPAIIAEENLSSLLPLSDIYIAVQGSTTIDWASMLSIPVIVMDFFDLFGYEHYNEYPGVFIADSFSKFEKIIFNIRKKGIIMSDFNSSLDKSTPFLDGNCLSRIIENII